MPPKRPSPAQPAPSLLALPPEVLQHILAAVPLADRLSHAALVCKQLHEACLAPALLSQLDVAFWGPRCVARAQALLLFITCHAQHVRSLQLDIRLPEEGAEEGPECNEVASLVAASLAACAMRQVQPGGGGLRQLSISPETPLVSTGCLSMLRALQQLRLTGRSSNLRLRLGDWRQLTALQDVQLSGRLLCEGEGPALPPSLTRLCIEGDLDWDDGALQEPSLDGRVLAGLPALRCLELAESNYTSASLAAVSGLTALTRLALHRVDNFPPAEALAALAPSLRTLQLHSVVESDVLNTCIQALTGLVTLAVDLGFYEVSEVELETATMQLPRLRCLCLTAYENLSGSPGTGGLPAGLPGGPYLSSLQRLALPLPLAVAAHPLLSQAPQLHTLCLQLPDSRWDYPVDQWPAFWARVAAHPSLRRLLYEIPSPSSDCPFRLLDALLELQQQRPALQVHRLAVRTNRRLNPPTCWDHLLAP